MTDAPANREAAVNVNASPLKSSLQRAPERQRTLTKLYNQTPPWLQNARRKLDAAGCAAYGWCADLSDDEILANWLALNLERAREFRSDV